MENKDTGLLLNKKNIEIHRQYFNQMVKLLGINVLYRAPRESKQYDLHGELDSKYCEPMVVGCIFQDHTDQKTMKKLGWNAERDNNPPTIHVPYDLPGIQAGALFIIPSAFDNTKGRVFKVTDMHASQVYPACISCVLGPVMESEFETSQTRDFQKTDFNLLNEEEEN